MSGSGVAGFTAELLDRLEPIGYDELPAAAVATTKDCLLDMLGVALAGWSEPDATIAFGYATATYGAGPATIIGAAGRIAPEGAALVNGTLAHAHDFDDTNWTYIGHSGAVILPAALAVGEAAGSSGRDVVAAFVAGLEAAARVGGPVTDEFARRGWHLTSAVGVFGAATAAARLLGLGRDGLAAALGLAASHASGLKANFGYMAKPLHAGMAAAAGVRSALLAQAGLTASPAVFEDPLGYFSAFAGGVASPVPDGPLAIVADGVAFKRFPSCTGTHPAVDAVLAIRADEGLSAGDVRSVRVGTTPEVPGELVHPRPAGGAQAKFSMPFAVAAALTYGSLGIEHFTDRLVADGAITALMDRCDVFVDPDLDRPAGVRAPAASVEITTGDGRQYRRRVDLALGNPGHPMPRSELVGKFRACAGRRLEDAERVTALLECVDAIEQADDLGRLMAAARGER